MLNLFKRNLNKCGKPITLQQREERIVNNLATEVFTTIATPTAIVKTLRGVKVFDSTNTERVATHQVCIDYIANVTAEFWILFKSKRLKILTVENCCEEDEVLILMCTERGDEGKIVNAA